MKRIFAIKNWHNPIFILLSLATAWLSSCRQGGAYESMHHSQHVLKCDDPWKLMPKINGKTIAIQGVYHHPDWESSFLDSTGRSNNWITLETYRKDLASQLPDATWFDGKRMSLIGRVVATPKFDGGYSMSLWDIESVNMDPP